MRAQCVRAYVYESKVFVSMVLILIFAEVLGLYGQVLSRPFLVAGSRQYAQVDCCADNELQGHWGGVYIRMSRAPSVCVCIPIRNAISRYYFIIQD